MITYVYDDLFQSPAKVLVNTVNTVGVMGKGIALDFKKIYPDMFKRYQEICEQGLLDVGKLWIYKTGNKWILNFPTKKHWRQKSKVEYIAAGLQKFVATYDAKGISSISFPMLGCGNGELDWESEVRPIMKHYLHPLPIKVYIHIYGQGENFKPEHRDIEQMKQWLQQEPVYLPFSEFWDDIIKCIESKSYFKLMGKTETFTVTHISNQVQQEDLLLQSSSQSILMEKTQFQELWQSLRMMGYCRAEDFPEGLDAFAEFIVAMLADLYYIAPVMLAGSSSESVYGTTGLKLNPLPQSKRPAFEIPATPLSI